MEFKVEDLKEIMQIIEAADEFVPIVKKAVEKSNTLLSELRPIFDNFTNYVIDSKIKMIKKFEEAGFSREEAILMTMDQWATFSNSLKSSQSKKSK